MLCDMMLIQDLSSYTNMDFILLSTLMHVFLLQLIFSYDIVCQWYCNLRKQLLQFPPFMHIPDPILEKAKFVILKFHLWGHGDRCQQQFSLNFLKHSAQTDGEEIERWWSHINPVSMSTKEMGPGAQHDTLDDHAAAWNW